MGTFLSFHCRCGDGAATKSDQRNAPIDTLEIGTHTHPAFVLKIEFVKN